MVNAKRIGHNFICQDWSSLRAIQNYQTVSVASAYESREVAVTYITQAQGEATSVPWGQISVAFSAPTAAVTTSIVHI